MATHNPAKTYAREEAKDRKTIFQRLKEQEQEGEDRLALQVVKWLGKAGFFAAPEADGGA